MQTLLQNYSPLCGLVTNPLPIDDQRNRQRHDRNIDPSHCTKGADITQALHPPIDAVEEAKGNDVLRLMSVNTSGYSWIRD
jgi:hypothetical protein